MKSLKRTQQRGECIPVPVWSLCTIISTALHPLQTESEGCSEMGLSDSELLKRQRHEVKKDKNKKGYMSSDTLPPSHLSLNIPMETVTENCSEQKEGELDYLCDELDNKQKGIKAKRE